MTKAGVATLSLSLTHNIDSPAFPLISTAGGVTFTCMLAGSGSLTLSRMNDMDDKIVEYMNNEINITSILITNYIVPYQLYHL